MFYLIILGLVLWTGAHYWKRLAPDHRASFGDKGKGIAALTMFAGIILMVIGYRGSDYVYVYDLGGWARGVNNLLMFVAIALLGLGSSKSRFGHSLRHPMTLGFLVWVVAHLLVNGDRDSIVLFGGLGLWAIGQMWLINRADPDGKLNRKPGSVAGDIRLAIITVVVYAVISGIHIWLGVNPFSGTVS